MSNPLERVEYAVLLALPTEATAARFVIAEPNNTSEFTYDDLDYCLTDIERVASAGASRMTVALISPPSTGNSRFAVHTMQVIQACPNLRGVIMCGIAGGIPKIRDGDDDIRLGDVVAQDQGGIIHHDYLSEQHGGGIKVYPKLYNPGYPPGASFLLADRRVAMEDSRATTPRWQLRLESRLNELGERFNRPSASTDRVFEPIPGKFGQFRDYWRARQEGDALHGWRVVARQGRDQTHPRLHHGKIASGNRVLRDHSWREWLRTNHRVLAVEMEGAGVATACHINGKEYFVVRGISDYCDPHKNDHWQPYAAAAAAAYVWVLLTTVRASTDVNILSDPNVPVSINTASPEGNTTRDVGQPRDGAALGREPSRDLAAGLLAQLDKLDSLSDAHEWDAHAALTLEIDATLETQAVDLPPGERAEMIYRLANAMARLSRSDQELVDKARAKDRALLLVAQAKQLLNG